MRRLLVLSILAIFTLTGCTDDSELKELNSVQALNSEANLTENYKLSYTDEQSMIYSQVSDRKLLDLSTLSPCTEDELQQIINYMEMVDSQLIGSISADSGVIEECFTDYLLVEFEKTPYYWQRSGMIVRGLDPVSRSMVVDVTYKTIGFNKDQQLRSPLVLGEFNYETKLRTRYNRWISILSSKYNNFNSVDWSTSYDKFVEVYGDPDLIYKSQSNETLTNLLYETGNQKTYEGLTDSDAELTGATMSVRYVLVPNYVLGINLGITCQHMYITEYKLDTDITDGKSVFTDEGYSTVSDSIYTLLYSYFQCIDESDYTGLYKLTADFGKLDNHFEDMFTTSYRKHENFSVSLFSIEGTHINCGVTISSKIRAKGSRMTFPSYTDRYYFELELLDGSLSVKNLVLLSRLIQGEPTITTDEAEYTGFASSIDLDNDDRIQIENLISNFGALQLLGEVLSDDFGNIVDLSMQTSSLTNLQTNMTSLSGVQKVTWILNYQQGTSSYASVRCRELFQSEDNSIVEAVVVYDFIIKGGRWYIYQYNISSSVKLDTTNLQTTGCLCLVSPGKVDLYVSQVKNTATVNDSISDISVAYTYTEYTPVLKEGIVEQGLNTSEGYNLSEEDYIDYLSRLMLSAGSSETSESILEFNDYMNSLFEGRDSDTDILTVNEMYLEMVAIYFNYINNRYTSGEMRRTLDDLDVRWTVTKQYWNDVKAGIGNSATTIAVDRGIAEMQKAYSLISRL